jgi:hypothetical protein
MHMETGPDFELLKDAYAIIDGIPEAAIDLAAPCSARGESLEHGTVCSPAGWLARHPAFNALGLAPSDDGSSLVFKGEAEGKTSAEVMAQVFRLPLPEAEHLFGTRDTYTLGDDSGLSDKRLWLREMRDFLKTHGQIDEAFEEQLETRGPFAEPPAPDQPRAL